MSPWAIFTPYVELGERAWRCRFDENDGTRRDRRRAIEHWARKAGWK